VVCIGLGFNYKYNLHLNPVEQFNAVTPLTSVGYKEPKTQGDGITLGYIVKWEYESCIISVINISQSIGKLTKSPSVNTMEVKFF